LVDAVSKNVAEKLCDISILISGQRFTSRTETLEKYFVKHARTLGVIANAGVRQTQNSNSRLYHKGELVKDFDMPGFNLKSESFIFTLTVGFYFLSFLKNFFTAYRKLDTKFDLFIGIQTWSTFLGVLLKKMGKVDRVIYYSIDYYKPSSRFGSKIESFVFRHLDRFCCRNADMIWDLAPHFRQDRKNDFGADYGDKEIYVPLTYSESLLMNRDLKDIERHSLGFVGTLEGGQGWEVLIKSIPFVKKAFPDFKVHIYGDGSYKPSIIAMIKESAAEDDVVMHGFIKDENELLERLSKHAAGVAPFQPHRAEYAGLDAGKPKLYALVGLPIIMTHTDYIASEFDKYKNGRAFRYDPQSLAETIIEVIEDDKALLEYKRRASEFARRFTSEQVFPPALEKTFAYIK
jgi:glycosyltransferase involved in cell wall biosynthesis